MTRTKIVTAISLAASLASMPSFAQDFYIGGSIGSASPDDAFNNGQFSTAFTTGEPAGIPAGGLSLPAGAPVSWNTDLDSDTIFTLNAGMKFGAVRYEAEYSQVEYDISGHGNVNTGGIDLDGIDAGILITGNTGLGVTTGDLVAAGAGSVDTSSLFLNAYYDFDMGNNFTPYVGGGIGTMDTDINYRPSDVQIIDDSDDVFVYQIILGVSYMLNDQFSLYADYRYRDAGDADVDATLIPASFDVENNQSDVFNVGARFSF